MKTRDKLVCKKIPKRGNFSLWKEYSISFLI